jgi:hypothetical protein
MTTNKKEINIARVIYDAYPHADLLPIDAEQSRQFADEIAYLNSAIKEAKL